MKFGTLIAMCREAGVKDSDELRTIVGYFDGSPATAYKVDVWPEDRADKANNQPKTIDVKKRPVGDRPWGTAS